MFNQIYLLLSISCFYLFFSAYGIYWMLIIFIVDKIMKSITFTKSFNFFFLMFYDSSDEIICHSCIKNAIFFVR